MKAKIYLNAKNGSYSATAIYEDGVVTVKKGSRIKKNFSEHVKECSTSKKYREDPSYVDNDGVTKKDCSFTSPSTAAQFVVGNSRNGWKAWHTEDDTTLKQYVNQYRDIK